jgi:hypothetical protein
MFIWPAPSIRCFELRPARNVFYACPTQQSAPTAIRTFPRDPPRTWRSYQRHLVEFFVSNLRHMPAICLRFPPSLKLGNARTADALPHCYLEMPGSGVSFILLWYRRHVSGSGADLEDICKLCSRYWQFCFNRRRVCLCVIKVCRSHAVVDTGRRVGVT